jgi:DNA-binding transcriptional MerR regulator
MGRSSYRVREFAELTGVTVKALQHYDRLGLLTPARTAAGYRLYVERDRERLDRIRTLKFLGIPLKQIETVLAGDVIPLSDALRSQREALVAERDRLNRAIAAVERVEGAIARGDASNAVVLKQLTDLIMRNEADAMRKYFTDEAWERWGPHYHDWPPPQWRELYQDVAAALDDDPCGERAEALLTRMYVLWNADTAGDRRVQWQIQEGVMRAWLDREQWPTTMQRRLHELRVNDVARFMGRVKQMVFLKRGAAYFKNFQIGYWTAA